MRRLRLIIFIILFNTSTQSNTIEAQHHDHCNAKTIIALLVITGIAISYKHHNFQPFTSILKAFKRGMKFAQRYVKIWSTRNYSVCTAPVNGKQVTLYGNTVSIDSMNEQQCSINNLSFSVSSSTFNPFSVTIKMNGISKTFTSFLMPLFGVSISFHNNNLIINGQLFFDDNPKQTQTIIYDAGRMEQETFELKDIIKIKAWGNVTVIITCNPNNNETITVTADENILPLIKPKTIEGTVHCGLDTTAVPIKTSAPIQYNITVKKLCTLLLRNSVEAHITQTNTENLHIIMSNAATLNGTISVSKLLTVCCSNASSTTLTGNATQQNIILSNRSTFDGSNLTGDSAEATLFNCSKAFLSVTKSIDYNIKNSSTITYYGKPQTQGYRANNGSIRAAYF